MTRACRYLLLVIVTIHLLLAGVLMTWLLTPCSQRPFNYSAENRNGELHDLTRDRHFSWAQVPLTWRRKMADRKRQITDTCALKHGPNYQRNPNHAYSNETNFFVDEIHGLIYCGIPKVGITNFKRLLYGLVGAVNVSAYRGIPFVAVHNFYHKRYVLRLKDFSPFGIELRLRNYLKVIVVRHPLERLVSAFRDKFDSEGRDFYGELAAFIAKKFELNPPKKTLKTGAGLLFRAFAKYVVNNTKNATGIKDHHWMSYQEICIPCDVDYDVIARYENIEDDVNFMLTMLGLATSYSFPDRDGRKVNTTAEVWKSYVSTVSQPDLKELREIFQTDAKMFNYTL